MENTKKSWIATLGPRQSKAFNKAIGDILTEGNTHDEVSEFDGKEFRSSLIEFSYRRPGDVLPPRVTEAHELLHAIGEVHGWTVDAKSYKTVLAELVAALELFKTSRPVVDKRKAA